MCTQTQIVQKRVNQNNNLKIKGQRQNFQYLKPLISSYQKQTEINSKATQIKQNMPIQLLENQTSEAVQLLDKIISHRQKYDLIQHAKLIEDKMLEWKFQGDKFQHYSMYNNYKAAVKKFNINEIYKDEEDFRTAYKKYVIQRHFRILQAIKEINDPILLRFFEITKGQNGITIKMQKGLVLPLAIEITKIGPQRGYFKFYSLLSNKTKLKFIKQITQSVKLLNSKGIWHNDIRIQNIVYSVQDNRFKLIDFDISRICQIKKIMLPFNRINIQETLLQEQQNCNSFTNSFSFSRVNFSYFQIFNVDKGQITSYNKILNKNKQIQDILKNSADIQFQFQNMYEISTIKTEYYQKNDKLLLAKLFENLFKDINTKNKYIQISRQTPQNSIYLFENTLFRQTLNKLHQFVKINEYQRQQNKDRQQFNEISNYEQKCDISTIQNTLNEQKYLNIKNYDKQIWRKADYVQEQDELKQKLQFDKMAFGQNSQEYTTNFMQLSNNLWKYGDYKKSLQFYQQKQRIDQYKNTEHYVQVIINIGALHCILGDYDKSLQLLFESVKILKNIFGEKPLNKNYVVSLNTIGLTYDSKRQFDLALTYYFQAIQIVKIVLGQMNILYASTMNNIGLTYDSKEEYDEALKYYFQSTKIRKIILGQNHPDYATSLNNIGSAYYNKKQYTNALQFYFQSIDIRKIVIGQTHTDYALSLYNIGLVYNRQEKFDKALQYFFQSIEIRRITLGQAHPDYVNSLYCIGLAYYDKKKYEQASKFLIKTAQLRKIILGQKHPDYATQLSSIGYNYYYQKDYDKALIYFIQAAQIWKMHFGQKNLLYTKSLNMIGLTYINKEEHSNYQEYHQQSLAIVKNFLTKQRYDKVIQYCNLSDESSRLNPGQLCVNYSVILNQIGLIYYKKGEYVKSLQYQFQSLRIMKIIYGQTDSNYTNFLKNARVKFTSKNISKKQDAQFQLIKNRL